MPYSEPHSPYPPGEDPGALIPVPMGPELPPQRDIKADAIKSQKESRDEFVKIVEKDLEKCLSADTNKAWLDHKCGLKLENIVKSIAMFNNSVQNNFGNVEELMISIDMLQPYMKKNQELLSKVDPDVNILGNLPIYVAGKPTDTSRIFDLTQLLTKGINMKVEFPYQLLASEHQLQDFVRGGASAAQIVRAVFGKMKVKDCEDIPDKYQSAKEQCKQLRANAKELIDGIKNNMQAIGPSMPPNEAPLFTPIDVHSPNVLVPSPGKFIQQTTEEQQMAAVEIQRIARGRAIRKEIAENTVNIEGVKMILPPLKTTTGGLTESDQRALLGGVTVDELKDKADENAHEKMVRDVMDEQDHEQMVRDAMDEQAHEEMIREAMDEQDHEQMARDAMDEQDHEKMARDAMDEQAHEEMIRQAMEDQAKEAKKKTMWLYDPNTFEVTKHQVFYENIDGKDEYGGGVEWDKKVKSGAMIFKTENAANEWREDQIRYQASDA